MLKALLEVKTISKTLQKKPTNKHPEYR